jgi:hypothetical protein
MSEGFKKLKEMVTSKPVMSQFYPSRLTGIETYASDFAKGAVLPQYGKDGRLQPVAFKSKKHLTAEINYDIHEKEMGAIVTAFCEWEHLLKSVESEVTVFTDHKNLEYFNSTKLLTRRQARCAEDLAGYHFKVLYRSGVKYNKPDLLSRRCDHHLGEEGEAAGPEPRLFFYPRQLIMDPMKVADVKVISLQSTFPKRFSDMALKDNHGLVIHKALQDRRSGLDPA